MTHFCKTCGRTTAEATFAKQSGSDRLRNFCNDCRTKKDRNQKIAPKPVPQADGGSSWLNLCADCRPDWGWNYRHVPTNNGKSKDYTL